MYPTEWTIINESNEQITIKPVKLTLFQQCKIIQCTGSNDLKYLLFFYKDTFITVQPLVKVKPSSFLAQAKKSGYHIHASNQLLSRLNTPSSPIKIKPLTQLLNTIKKNFSAEEAALILSYFDSYIPADKLDPILKEMFFAYRRNGKLLAAYGLTKILLSRGYKQKWIVAATNHQDYTKASNRYQEPLSTLLPSDPIYVEQQCFLDLRHCHNLLMTIYEQQDRSIDPIIIATAKCLKNTSPLKYSNLVQTLSYTFDDDEILLYLQSLAPFISPKSGLHEDVFQRLIKKQDYTAAVHLLFTDSFPLSTIENDELTDILEKVSLPQLGLSLNVIAERLFPLYEEQPQKLEVILRSALPQLLNHFSLSDIDSWLQGIQYNAKPPVVEKIKDMNTLLNDPDSQSDLGSYYYEFEQYDKAIECFNFDMEMHPRQVKPVQWLAKTYTKLGEKEEAKIYQNLLIQLQRTS